ncbi:MAG: ADP-ribosylglycohydrolase family protein [Spirochaetes bacterium]|nr:ADP-ribosylglycohydrolase family protein [Spirochaetota bacterium]
MKSKKPVSKITDTQRVLGCLKGKAIGGTLGTPHEGKMKLMDLTFYDPVPTGILPNDDFDLQLLFLEAVENAGGVVDTMTLARTWIEKVQFPWDEYGVANLNIRRGFKPPVTGWFDNPFKHCMGSPIRSEMWALLAPRRPALAAYFAMQDAMIDHSTEGMAGEMFFAAFESAAFDGGSMDDLIATGLAYTPKNSITYRAVRFALDNYKKFDWPVLREKILEQFGHPNFTEAPQNIAFTIIGLLYFPNDFDKALLSTTNCGYDTDCTAATIGAMWGVMYGDNFPERWLKPIGENVLASHGVVDMSVAATLTKLAVDIERVRGIVAKRYAKVTDAKLKAMTQATLAEPGKMKIDQNSDITIDYGKSPVLNGTKKIPFTGAIKKVFTKQPFSASIKGKAILLNLDKKAPFYPTHVKVTAETADGSQYEFALVTAHEMWIGTPASPDAFASLASSPFDALAKDGKVKPFTLDERLFLLKDLPDAEWLHLGGHIHLGSYGKYRLAAYAECPVQGFLDGVQVMNEAEGAACIPAPHRGGKPGMIHDAELKGGWHRWDVFLNKKKAIREGKVTLVLAYAYDKQLIDFKFRRSNAGVYAH